MKKIIIGLTAIFAFCMSGASFANGDVFAPLPAHVYAQSGVVFGAHLGYGMLDTPSIYLLDRVDNTTDFNVDSGYKVGRYVWGLNVGYGFAVTHKLVLGVEGGYQDLGRTAYDSDVNNVISPNLTQVVRVDRKITQYAIAFLLTGKYFVYDGFNIIGKFGFAAVSAKTKQSWFDSTLTPNYPGFANYSKTLWRLRPEMAAGFGYMFRNNINIFVMFKHIFSGASGDGTAYAADFPGSVNLNVFGSSNIVGGISFTLPIPNRMMSSPAASNQGMMSSVPSQGMM